MTVRMCALILLGAIGFGGTAHASCGPRIAVAFVEAAPTDRFDIVNRSDAGWHLVTLTLDLGPSAGRLYFDTSARGAGIQVSQPFESAGGRAQLATVPTPTDGDVALRLDFARFAPGMDHRFTIDVDDRLPGGARGPSQIVGAEIAGATVSALLIDPTGQQNTAAGVFKTDGQAQLSGGTCV